MRKKAPKCRPFEPRRAKKAGGLRMRRPHRGGREKTTQTTFAEKKGEHATTRGGT